MIDWVLIAIYAIAAVYLRPAIIPLIAFTLTMMAGVLNIPQPFIHGIFIAIYLIAVPFSTVKIAWGMVASTIVNLFAVAYFLSPLRLDGFVLYFALAMTMVNLYILFTIFRGVKNGELATLDSVVYIRAINLYHNQALATQVKRR